MLFLSMLKHQHKVYYLRGLGGPPALHLISIFTVATLQDTARGKSAHGLPITQCDDSSELQACKSSLLHFGDGAFHNLWPTMVYRNVNASH